MNTECTKFFGSPFSFNVNSGKVFCFDNNNNNNGKTQLHTDDHQRTRTPYGACGYTYSTCFTILIPYNLMLFMAIMKFCCFRRQPVFVNAKQTNARSRITIFKHNCTTSSFVSTRHIVLQKIHSSAFYSYE